MGAALTGCAFPFYSFKPSYLALGDGWAGALETEEAMKLLIADDNSAMRSLIKLICQDVTVDVLECSNGLEAVSLCAMARPDWVLMDIVMPELDGLKATARLRQAFPEVRIIVVTEFDTPEYRLAAQRAGALHFVGKDNLQELLRLLK